MYIPYRKKIRLITRRVIMVTIIQIAAVQNLSLKVRNKIEKSVLTKRNILLVAPVYGSF